LHRNISLLVATSTAFYRLVGSGCRVMNMAQSERRKHKRLYLTLPSELELGQSTVVHPKRINGAVKVISAVAALLVSDERLGDGEEGVLELILPTDLGPRIRGSVLMHVPGGVVFKFNREQQWVMGLL